MNLLSVLVLRLVTCLLSSDHKLKIWSTGLQIWALCGSDIMFILGHVLPCLSETIKSNQIYLLLFPQRESRATSSCFSWWTPRHPQVRGDIIWVCGFYPLQCYPEQASPIPTEGHCWLKPGGHWRTSEGWWFTCHLRFSTLFCFVLNHLFHRLLVFTLHYTNAVGIRTRWIMLVQEPEGSLLFWLGQTWKKTKPIFVLVLFIDVALKKKIFACDLSTVRRHPCSGSYSGTMIPSNSRSQNGWERKESRCCDCPDLSLTDMLCSESCAQTNTANLNELMQHCEEEWARIPPQWHERLINHTENDYFSLLLVKVVLLHHQSKLVFTGLVEG